MFICIERRKIGTKPRKAVIHAQVHTITVNRGIQDSFMTAIERTKLASQGLSEVYILKLKM